MRFTISGAPRTKKTSNRIIRLKRKGGKGTYPKVLPSEAFDTWSDIVLPQLRQHAAFYRGRGVLIPVPLARKVNVAALFYTDGGSTPDAVGLYQALADLLQAAGLLANDSQALSWVGSEVLVDRIEPRVVVELTFRAAGVGWTPITISTEEAPDVRVTLTPRPRRRRRPAAAAQHG